MRLVVDDVEIFVGTGRRALVAGQPLAVFLHGAGFDHTVWTGQTERLTRYGWNVLAPDLPGHGQSDGAPFTSIGAMADWVTRLIAAAGVEAAPCVKLVGHSMGAGIALEVAAHHAGDVPELALIGVAASMRVHPGLLAAAGANDPAAIDMIVKWGHAPGTLAAAETRRVLERAKPGVLHADLTACDEYRDALASVAKVSAPVTLILGELDRMTPMKGGKELAAVLPNARVVVIEGAGHMLMAERPDEVLAALVGS